ncbi:MAG: MATE family efflux transporter, partial [Roseburia sp.]|nr:MATE family efflux transporter [Roseburia sp.]
MNKTVNREQILSGNMVKAILLLSVPVVINSFLQTMYNLTDTYWLGKLGTEELAAINLVTPVQNLVINFGAGITVAGSVLISQFIGAKKDEDARSMANHIFVCAMGFAIVCAAVVAAATPAIVTWLGAEGET